MEHIKIFGDRVAFTELGYEMSGQIAIPQLDKFTTFRIGKVVAIGDGEGMERVGRRVVRFDGKMFVRKDDAVVFQIPRQTTVTCAYFIKGLGEVSIVLQSDCISRINPVKSKDPKKKDLEYIADIDNIEMLGDWILLASHKINRNEGNRIIVPDTVENILDFRLKVVQLGIGGKWDDAGYKVGDTVMVDKLRCTPYVLASTDEKSGLPTIQNDFYFLHKDYVLGVIEE